MFRSIDWVTIVLYFILVIFGVISIYAASYDFDNASIFDFSEFSGKQIMWIGLSLIMGGCMMLVDYRVYETYAYPIYLFVLLLLFITIFIAPNINGSHSWIVLGPVSLQPAEFGKFATALALAKLFSSYNFKLNQKISNYLRALIIIFLPIILILAQNETGSALVYFSLVFVLYREGMSGMILFSFICAITYFVVSVKFSTNMIMGIAEGEFIVYILIMLVLVGMLFTYCKNYILGRNVLIAFIVSGVILSILAFLEIEIPGRFYFLTVIFAALIYIGVVMLHHKFHKYIIAIGFTIISLGFLFSVNYVFEQILEPHQQMRIKVALGIVDDPRGVGYNVNQSKIAIGSGGFSGKGFLMGTQTKLKYVPEQHTDFIFCTIGEEEGFIGSLIVLSIFLALILRLIHIAERQRTVFGRVYAYCVVSYLIFHILINIGMVIGLCPVIGIPLPFFSYGGSALLGFTILLIILLRIDASRKERWG